MPRRASARCDSGTHAPRGIKTIVFNNTPAEDLNGEAVFYAYSDWPTKTTDTHPLFDLAPDVLMYQTLIHMAAYLRDENMVGAYKALRDESINTLTRAEDEIKYRGEKITMAYRPPYSQ